MTAEARQADGMRTRAPAPRRTAGRPRRILLVDDHPAVRYGICQLLSGQDEGITIVEAGAATRDTVDLARWLDVAVVDYHLGDRDGLWLTQQIKQLPSPPPVLIYSAFADPPLAAAAIAAGADGLVRKTALAAELYIAIRRLFHGRSYFPTVPRALAVALGSRLDQRERAIFWMLIQGVGPNEICSQLSITPEELRRHRRSMVDVIAPNAGLASLSARTSAPLDYRRPRRPYPGA
jgi:DNA-binding NarL/FixJ family response regulator